MKKIALFTASLAIAAAATAQVTVQGSRFTDNWSVGLKGGMVTPLKNHAFWGEARGVIGVELRKQVIPSLGFGIEGEWSVNTSSWWNGAKSKNAFDHQYVGVFGALNLMNAFGGYTGTPRPFEVELVAGTGWIHSYNLHGYPRVEAFDANSWGNKLGLNVNFNLGAGRAWTLGIKPAILWNMGAKPRYYYAQNLSGYSARYNANAAAFELMASVTYHFGNSNGTHSFVISRLYDQAEVDDLNSQINNLRNDLDNCNANGAALQGKVNSLKAELDACNRRPPVIREITKNLDNVRYIFFNLGSSNIQNNQKPNLELIAKSLEQNSAAQLDIKGYASPEGSKAFNQRLSARRAEAVKNALVKSYKVDASRIETEGLGVGDIFNVSSWNRVAVCTVK